MSRLAMIKTMKDFLKNERPHRNYDGHKVQVLFLRDYIIYALLREKKDFTKCSTDKNKAVLIANDWLNTVSRAIKQFEVSDKYDWDVKALKYKIGIDFTLEDLIELELSIKRQIESLSEKE